MSEYASTMEATAPELKLTALDRCDSCKAQAKSLVTLESGGELMFCNHHLAKHRQALEEQSARIQVDES